MSIFSVGPENFELITIQASPKRFYISSSFPSTWGFGGITGSAELFARKSDMIKEVAPLGVLSASNFNEDSFRGAFHDYAKHAGQRVRNGQPFNDLAKGLLDKVNSSKRSKKQDIVSKILRFEPSFTYTNDTGRKLSITNILMPDYRIANPNSQFAYTNYHCLNFFTSSNVPRGAALLYPNSSSLPDSRKISGSYVVDNGFTFEFFIKPKNTQKQTADYHPGTILHLSSNYAISLVTGSSRDVDGFADTFRIKLQLSHSADRAPETAAAGGGYPDDLVFLSQEGLLKKDHWHHVAIRWSAKSDSRLGAFYVDNKSAGAFEITASSVAPKPMAHNPAALVVGNYYRGTNLGTSRQAVFFGNRVAQREGIVRMDPNNSLDQPASFALNNPLSAELHEVRIFDRYRTDQEMKDGMSSGISRNTENLRFYLPPLFTRHSPTRQPIGGFGGILQTPFFGISGSTVDPFDIAMSFGVGGRYLNLENFTRDFATNNFPRAMDLTGAQITSTTTPLSCNDYLYYTGSTAYRNLFMLPCDNGRFFPNFNLIREVESGSFPTSTVKTGSSYYKYRNDLNDVDLSLINLRNLLPSSSFRNYIVDVIEKDEDGNPLVKRDTAGKIIGNNIVHVGAGFETSVLGSKPENLGIDPGEVFTIFQRTRDDSSNEVVIFDISNLFYGKRIKPGTFVIKDNTLTGSGGDLTMTLKDDGYGSLYRADGLSDHAKWNSVGNIYYNEGIAIIKSPNIPIFGKDSFQVEFRGENEVHVFKTDVVAPAGFVNSSSNPNYIVASSSAEANDKDSQFVAITGINFHDDNLNVIMKTKFAQPVIKKSTDKILFRNKLDF